MLEENMMVKLERADKREQRLIRKKRKLKLKALKRVRRAWENLEVNMMHHGALPCPVCHSSQSVLQ